METSKDTSDSDEFGRVLEDLARPPVLAVAFAVPAADRSPHPLDAALRLAGQRAAGAQEPQPGDVLEGRYRITGLLGRGGMGVVLEAEQLRSKKTVAIKWMSARGELERSAAQVERFLREARAVANIQHPNVVDLYDVGDCEGTPFLVLERLRGESLRKRLERGAMSWQELEPLMQGVLAGVGAVHAAGIVHRDLKPDNIFLARDGASVVPKILDFGVAAMRENTAEGLSSLTRTGALLGTPSYMALEQLTGGEVDKRADLYALGVLLYECLTGRLPFDARSAPELAVLLATRSTVPPSKFVSGLERDLEVAILRALERKPEDRYPEVSSFASALKGDATQLRGRRLRRHAGLGMALLTVVGSAALWVRAEQSAVRSSPAQRAFPSAERTQVSARGPASASTGVAAPPDPAQLEASASSEIDEHARPLQVTTSAPPDEPVNGSLGTPVTPVHAQPLETARARLRNAQHLDRPTRPRSNSRALPASTGVEPLAASETPRNATEIRVEDF